MTSTTTRLLAALAAALALGATPATGQTPVRMILPVGAGSGVDTIMRAAQGELSKTLGQPVVIENLPGAGGITGTSALVKAAPDGNTIGVLSNNHAVNPSVYKTLPYDSLKDITPISVIGSTPFVLVVNPAKVPARDAKELQAFLKAKPGAYNYASSGNGTIIHLAGEMVVDAMGVDVKHVPYKGVGPQLTDLIGGQVEMGVVALPAVQGHLKSGALRAIGVMGSNASRRCPTCRRSPNRASPASTSPAGSSSSDPRSCRRRRSSASTTRSSPRSALRTSRPRWRSRRTSSRR